MVERMLMFKLEMWYCVKTDVGLCGDVIEFEAMLAHAWLDLRDWSVVGMEEGGKRGKRCTTGENSSMDVCARAVPKCVCYEKVPRVQVSGRCVAGQGMGLSGTVELGVERTHTCGAC